MKDKLYLLKLGGSLITDKSAARTPRLDVLKRLAEEIAHAHQQQADLGLVIGHGAGSFAHLPAMKHKTRQGVDTPQQWLGFVEVWWEASALNRLVMDALHQAGLPVICLPPSASVIAQDGQVKIWNLSPLTEALENNLIPVIHGDVVFDTVRGGTILSTEDLFGHLARKLHPQRILLAGIEAGVWEDYPLCKKIISHITPNTYPDISIYLTGSQATDVTGGMASKVKQNIDLVREIPDLEVLIFSGIKPNQLASVLLGSKQGTMIHT